MIGTMYAPPVGGQFRPTGDIPCPNNDQFSYADVISIASKKTRLQVKPQEIYKGKSTAFFTPQEEEESAKDCRFTIVEKFSHGKPTIDDIRQRIQQGIKAKLNKKNVMKWAARPPKDNNLQQKLSQAKNVIHDFLRSSNVIDVDTGIIDGGKKLELEVGKVQFEVHLPAVKPITTSNSFKHLEEFDKDMEVCYSEDDAKIYKQDKLTKSDKDFARKLQTKSPYVLDNYRPILSGKPPNNVHNEAQGINLEVQLWSPNSLVDVPLQVITPTDENSTGNQANNEDNSEDEEDEYDSDYGVEQERNTEEGSDEEFEECDSSDEDALIDAFAPKTSWKGEKVEDTVSQHRQSLTNNGNLSPRLVSRNANVNHKDFAKSGPITWAMGKAFQIGETSSNI
uniref:Uncharacterized protein n=1 Tax=Solanum tuberosum TaxID=4113 RepID=M1DHH3_SOLTU